MANYSFDEVKTVKIADGKTYIRVTIWARSLQDVPAYDDFSDIILAPGSVAIIPSTSSIYVLDFDNVWKIWGKEGGESE